MIRRTVLAVALCLPGPWGVREPPAERAGRVLSIVAAAHDAARGPEGRAWPWATSALETAALTVTYHEGWRWHPAVHSGRLTGDHGRARCLGGIWQTALVPAEEWRASAGLGREATELCLRLVVRVLSHHASRCQVGTHPSEYQAARLFHAYGTGSCPRRPAKWALERARFWSVLESRTQEDP